jgi:ankyrin repeat protein
MPSRGSYIGNAYSAVMGFFGVEVEPRETALHVIVSNDDPEEVRQAIAEHPEELNARDEYDNTPLHRAAQYGCLDSIRVLLAAGAERFPRNNCGDTPFDTAVYERQQAAAHLLIFL